MHLYSGTTQEFLRDSTHNAIAGKLGDAFFAYFRYKPSESERRSWHNSLRSLADILRLGELNDHGILLEYQLPLTSRRLDAMITGRDTRRDRAVIVELKQWENAELADADDLLRTWIGGDNRHVLHPAAQVHHYRRYLEDVQDVFHDGEDRVVLDACAYLHNYSPRKDDALFAERSEAIRRLAPVFTADDGPRLAEHLQDRVGRGDGERILRRVAESRYKPAKKLLLHVAGVIRNEPAFVLLDEQQVVFSKILATVKNGIADRRKHVFVVRGGPGTGKSVLALNLLGVLSGMGVNAQHATGSKAFTSTLQKIVGTRAAYQFRYFNNFGQANYNDVDVLICDEAHRIRRTSNNRFTRKEKLSARAQIQEIVDAAKVSVFLLDDRQIVRPNEIGSSLLIREQAACSDALLHEYDLEAQFRCAGSETFVGWIDKTLGVRETPHVLFDQAQESFEFGIVSTPGELDRLIREKVDQGSSARLVAGYCWPWSKELGVDGALVDDIRIGDFRRPWNARPDMKRLPRNVPKADYWAYDPAGIDQVGCIYTAQGFEFDYVGVIWGKDLRYDPEQGAWTGDATKSSDAPVKRSRDSFLALVKNTYRVLLSRGMKGCYVYFEDVETEKFVRSRTENLGFAVKPALARPEPAPLSEPFTDTRPFLPMSLAEVEPWQNAVPLLDLKVAAGDFSDVQVLESEAVEWVSLPAPFRVMPGYFVAQIIGESMNRHIPSGSWALFSTDVRGTKQGKTVLAERHDLGDPEDSGRFTLKTYSATKRESDDGLVYESVCLKPNSTDPSYRIIDLDLNSDDIRIAAMLVAVLH